jgi:predicted GNAT family acetyltransferase
MLVRGQRFDANKGTRWPARPWPTPGGPRMPIMDLKVTDNTEQSRYEITADGELAGHISYELGDGIIDLQHTQTDDKFRGHGIGGNLVQATLDSARERHLTVVPTCPFVRRWLGEHRDYLDLVPAGRQAEFGL